MDLGIAGKTALVTGASKGIGRAIVEELASEGVKVIAAARGQEGLDKLAQSVKNVEVIASDLTEVLERQALVDSVTKKYGAIDILVHNVGGPSPTEAASTSLAQWHEGFERLFQSVAQLNLSFVPGMCERGFGRVICVTSLSVIEPIAALAVSNAMRSAVTSMLKTLSDEVAASGVTINCVAPGLIATDRLKDLMQARIAKSGQSEEQYQKEYLKSVPLGRLGTPREFAAVVAFLASTRASYVTGSTICVDGGKRRSTY